MSFLVIVLLAALIAALVYMMRRKSTRGSSCCGSKETMEPRIKPKDRNKSHYPYHYEADIDGMVCNNCARRVENAFQKNDGIMAHVNLSRKNSDILSKEPLNSEDVRNILNGTSYTLMDFREIADTRAS